jgi:chemotaxis protein methyltransferase CheR
LPQHFVDQALDREGRSIASSRATVKFLHQDLRSEAPDSLFDLILCRYVAFTYFADALQRQVLMRLIDRLAPHGYLAIGTHEQLPIGAITLQPLPGAPQIFSRKTVIGS